MIKVFADSSVFFSSITSSTGGARELLKRHTSGEIQIIVSQYVLDEVRQNLSKKSPSNVGVIDMLLDLLALEIVEVSASLVRDVAAYTELKDAPVVAGAITGECEYLLTHDKKHLLGKSEIADNSGLIIATPGDLLQVLRDEG